MTTMEARAAEACKEFKKFGGGYFSVYWTKSRTWGSCPRIEFRGDKAAYAGGCGYDKLSAVIAEFLSPLVPEVGHCSGAGLGSVQACLDKAGWELTQLYDGKTEDGFKLAKK